MNLLFVILFVTMVLTMPDATQAQWRIRHGNLAQRGQFPSTVLIFSGKTICTASIIGDNKVLTAGHCVCGPNKMRSVYTETLTTINGPLPGTKYDVASYSVNPRYSRQCEELGLEFPGIGVSGSDMAVITIKGTFQFSETVKQGVVAKTKPKPTESTTIAGYGKDENGKVGTLKFGSIQLTDCNPTTFADSFRAICYIANENMNRHATGGGDSGGPMLLNGEIVGVTSGRKSWRHSKGIYTLGVYSSTAKNMDFIKNAVKD